MFKVNFSNFERIVDKYNADDNRSIVHYFEESEGVYKLFYPTVVGVYVCKVVPEDREGFVMGFLQRALELEEEPEKNKLVIKGE